MGRQPHGSRLRASRRRADPLRGDLRVGVPGHLCLGAPRRPPAPPPHAPPADHLAAARPAAALVCMQYALHVHTGTTYPNAHAACTLHVLCTELDRLRDRRLQAGLWPRRTDRHRRVDLRERGGWRWLLRRLLQVRACRCICTAYVVRVPCKYTACMPILRTPACAYACGMCMCMYTAARGTSGRRWSTAAGSTLCGSTFPRRYARRGVRHTLLRTTIACAVHSPTLPASVVPPPPRSSSVRSPPASLSPSCSCRASPLQRYWTASQPALSRPSRAARSTSATTCQYTLSHNRPWSRTTRELPSRAARSPLACSTTARLPLHGLAQTFDSLLHDALCRRVDRSRMRQSGFPNRFLHRSPAKTGRGEPTPRVRNIVGY